MVVAGCTATNSRSRASVHTILRFISSVAYQVQPGGLREICQRDDQTRRLCRERTADCCHRSTVYAFLTLCGSNDLQQYQITASGATQMHVVGATEPNGFSKRVDYDTLLRTAKETDVAGLASQTEWDAVKDLELSSSTLPGSNQQASMTTTIDQSKAMVRHLLRGMVATCKPTAAYAAQIPKTTTAYDEGLVGPAASWYNVKGSSFSGSPKLYTHGVDADKSLTGHNFVATPPSFLQTPAWMVTDFLLLAKFASRPRVPIHSNSTTTMVRELVSTTRQSSTAGRIEQKAPTKMPQVVHLSPKRAKYTGSSSITYM